MGPFKVQRFKEGFGTEFRRFGKCGSAISSACRLVYRSTCGI